MNETTSKCAILKLVIADKFTNKQVVDIIFQRNFIWKAKGWKNFVDRDLETDFSQKDLDRN